MSFTINIASDSSTGLSLSLSMTSSACSEQPSADELHTNINTCTSYSMCSMCSVYLTNKPNMTLLQGKKWVQGFLALGTHEGYQKKHVTPYMHAIVYHAPTQIRMYGNLRMFSGQDIGTLRACVLHIASLPRNTKSTGVEKNNDMAKRNFYSCNRHDPCGEILFCEG